jgi:acetyltransferase-like isoleucine patch superfamily enzyme
MTRRVLRIVKRLTRQFHNDHAVSNPIVTPSSELLMEKSVVRTGGKIMIGNASSLNIGAGASINADILIGNDCHVSIAKNCHLHNVTFDIQNHSILEIGEGVRFDSPPTYPNIVTVNNGTLHIAERTRVQSEILVRFGGKLRIGRHTGISYGSEIRCEEQVDIGNYVLISYNVCIYDTNTHSTDWQQRRKRIELGYPYGPWEEQKPETKPIRIGDDVWIGKGATITKGSVIGNRCIVGIATMVGGGVIEDDCVVVSDKPRVMRRQ